MEKLPITKIKTNRFLFHVAHPANREGILEFGLLIHNRENSIIPNGVFAHNLLSKPTYHWYPFVLIGDYDDELGTIYGNEPLRLYDYWRIDTHQIDNDWFIDYAARGDFGKSLGYDPKTMYVYTNKDVSLRALTLFRFQNEECYQFKGENGTYHFRNVDEFRPYTDL